MADCNVVKKNLGPSKCNKLPSMPKSMITTPVGFAIPKATLDLGDAAIKTYLNDALLSGEATRIYYWPKFATFENISEEPVYEDGPLRYSPVRDGNYRFRFGIVQNICLHKAMYTHRASSGRVLIIDTENQLFGTELSTGDMAGFNIEVLHTEKFIFNDGSVSTKSPILLALADNKEVDRSGLLLDVNAFINELYRIVDVEVEVVTVTDAGDIDVSVTAECDGTPISGLVVADFVFLNAAGVAVAITAAVENANIPGQYKLTQAGDLFVDGTVDIDPPATLSVKAYESIAPAAVSIP